jgi:hypothetical protein
MPVPNPICLRCSKPIKPGTAAQYAGRPVHMRCLAGDTQRKAIEFEDAASQERQRAQALVQRAEELVAHTKIRNRVCPVCVRPLTEGGSVLFQGELLVHALCWRVDSQWFHDPPPLE